MYLICNFSIQPSLVLFLTLTILKRATALITQASLLRKSLYAMSGIGSYHNFVFRIFLLQYIILWSDIAVLITPGWEMLSCAFVKIWSIRVEVLQVILVGQFINCLKPYIEQNSLQFFNFGRKVFKMIFNFVSFIKNTISLK